MSNQSNGDNNNDDDDLYGDIETLARSAAEEQAQKRLQKSIQQRKQLENEVKDYKEQIHLLLQEKSQIEQNMMCLYNTAVSEISRKDKQLTELRTELLKAQNLSKSNK